MANSGITMPFMRRRKGIGRRVMLSLSFVAVTLFLVAATQVVGAPSIADAEESAVPAGGTLPYCIGFMDNPHPSSGAGGIIAKGRWQCTPGVNSVTFALFLFLCPQPPSGPESSWPSQGCSIQAMSSGTIPNPGPEETRYVPELGQPGAHGTGYFIACNMFFYQVGGHISPTQTVVSNAVFLSG